MSDRRVGWLLVALSWVAFAWFHQGGGWNQNGRFAMVRALVEEGRPWIDDFAVYRCAAPSETTRLERVPVRAGRLALPSGEATLAWTLRDGRPAPLDPAGAAGRLVPLDGLAISGDLAFARGHLHPNKAPGTSFLAVPAYALARAIERIAGLDPDDARVLTINGWWSGAASVALVAALGVGIFWALAVRLSRGDRRAALAATLAFAFGTLYFPYATMLYEHDLVAVGTLAAIALLWGGPEGDGSSPRAGAMRLAAAGACLGAAVATSYLAVVTSAIVVVWVGWRDRRPGSLALVAAGASVPLLLLGAYDLACFGTVATTNYAWENPFFKDGAGGFMGIFRLPDPGVLVALLVSPYRGLFVGSPALLVGAAGLAGMIARRELRREGALFGALVLSLLAFNVSFGEWHGGWAAGPRYLVPALPFLALPIAVVHARRRRISTALIAVSIAATSLVTAVDAQPPVGNAVYVAGRPRWADSPILDFDLPLFLRGRPPEGLGASNGFPAHLWRGFVSSNPAGLYESRPVAIFPADSPIVRGNAFNVGEWLFGSGRASVLPLFALVGLPLAWTYRRIAQPRSSSGSIAR